MRRILWFRRDLRVEDNPLLSLEGEVLPIFIFDTAILSKLSPHDRRVTFIYHAVIALKQKLKERGLNLAVFYGDPIEVFKHLLSQYVFDEVCASGDYDEYALARDRDISHLLPFHALQDTYIFHPDEVLKSDGKPYLVFTPFYNRAKEVFRKTHMIEYQSVQQKLVNFAYDPLHRITSAGEATDSLSLEAIGFIPQLLTSYQQYSPDEKLARFRSKLADYPKNRDFMALEATSGLSTDLRFGTLSIRSLLRWLSEQKKSGIDTEPFFRQLIFREFYAMLLYHFPHLATKNFRYPFYGIENNEYFEAFYTARTGVPIIDAGVRELLESGEMHNRVRMICASFFTKNLLLPWQWGERFFAEHLMDYDASSNILSWQWSAGTGVDPQPYFRIFNPAIQSEKFDKQKDYIHKHLPPDYALAPIVDHKASSQKALEYFKNAQK